MDKKGQVRVGVYVDMSNIAQNGGYGMHYDQLREFACRENGMAMRLNVYVAYDEEKASQNADYRTKTDNYHSMLRDYGFKVIVKKMKWYFDENNNRYGKANADLDMAVDALCQSDRLDYVLLATGDGDFLQVVKALQNKGCRVEVLAFKNVSGDLRREADIFSSGYLVPDLLPIESDTGKGKWVDITNRYDVDTYNKPNNQPKKWGEIGSRVRGICYNWFHEKGYGFLRYLKDLNGDLYILDTRREESPYETVFVHETQISNLVNIHTLPNRDVIFEFQLERNDKGVQAIDVKVIQKY